MNKKRKLIVTALSALITIGVLAATLPRKHFTPCLSKRHYSQSTSGEQHNARH